MYKSACSPFVVTTVRYFLLREISPTEDGDYTEEKFKQRYNSDLAGGIGNLVARVVALVAKYNIQNTKYKIVSKNPEIRTKIKKAQNKCYGFLDNFRFNEALVIIWELISFCDEYIEQQKPWSFDPSQDKEKQKEVIGNLLFTISEIAELLKPFLPETSEKILKQLTLRRGSGQEKSEILFPRI